MAFLSKLFGKKDKDESKKEEIELDELFDEEKDEANEEKEEIEIDGLFDGDEDDGESLTDEEIEAAEKFEAENS